ncbi:TolC family protein [Flavihumibacter sp. UBA7668]|uniref:TolC family protein n=1 Tax=Flavihumibacter sp. UBA7668 TaxID=1946542 RepID=UPI0025B7FEB3|nr:TolC family protein [Flavihumibacter sp. UBA7668]
MLRIEDCYIQARNNYPLVKQMSLIEQAKQYSISNASKAYLPQVSFNGQATYQSEVTEIKLPAASLSLLSKDQYRVTGEIYQTLSDFGTIKQQREQIKSQAETEKKQTAVELYKLNERINQLYFGVLLLERQLQQNEVLKSDLQAALDKTMAAIENGTALQSNGAELEAELIKAAQRTIELKAAKNAYLDMLSLFTGQKMDTATRLQLPERKELDSTVRRPEINFFEAQKRTLSIQTRLINNRNIPKIGAFFQGGYGRPGLNMLNNEFRSFYITGLRMNWNFTGLYTAKKEKKLVEISLQKIDLQKESFLLNTRISLSQQEKELEKYVQLIKEDEAIVGLRKKIKTSAKAQVENGVITIKDYISYINEEDLARQQLLLHQVQLLLAQHNYLTISGNQ